MKSFTKLNDPNLLFSVSDNNVRDTIAKKDELSDLLNKLHNKIDRQKNFETEFYFLEGTSFYDPYESFRDFREEICQDLISLISLTEIYKHQGITIEGFDQKIPEIKQLVEAHIGPLTKDDLEAIDKKITVEIEPHPQIQSSSLSM